MKKIYSAAMTPLTEDNKIDKTSLKRMVARNIRHRIDGFFVLGTMGEWSQFTKETKSEIVAATCEAIEGRAEILAGINGNSFLDIAENIKELSAFSIDAFVLMLPSTKLSSGNSLKLIKRICAESDKKFYFYHNPAITGHNLNADDIGEIMTIPNMIGIKNSSGCMKLRKELLMLRKEIDFQLFEGHEWAVDEALILGCDGIVVGQGSLSSNVLRQIADTVESGDFEKAMKIQHTFVEILLGVYGKDLSNIWIGQKYALEKLGLFENHKCLIQDESVLTEKRKSEIETCLEKYKEILD
ncbi:MAG: dihydrodipicolinate synthase family protein [Phycisphaerae bacterium]|nr:dihydrodipicolinate synthase family protein [Phycisphaerae bacterium]